MSEHFDEHNSVVEMKDPLTQRMLADAMCNDPNCNEEHELFMVQKCHTTAGVDALYTKSDGVLTIQCHVCHRLVAELQIEKGGDTDMSEVTSEKPTAEAEEAEGEEAEEGQEEGEGEGEAGEADPKA